MWTPSPEQIITAEQRAEAALATLRAERNARLAASDWIVTRSWEIGEPIPQEWLDYRQALRDLPNNTTNPNWPECPING